tara:strand:- start:1274 stop:1480 length:207 start_codon:yes stop_codon:yes gene_type:complete
MNNKIITRHEYPPIPIRDYDWSAVRQDYEPGDPIGHGKTEQDAIEDLLEAEHLIKEIRDIWDITRQNI